MEKPTPLAKNTPLPLHPGFFPNIKFDVVSGFFVFLIAMPLCLGIAKASYYPPIAGIWTSVIGGVLCTFLSNSQLTIKGPAAGLIVIVEGAVIALGRDAVGPDAPMSEVIAAGYPLALGIGVVAGVMQTLFGLLKAGRLGELVPLSPIHGMLAAIGITIMAKQLYPMLGMSAPAGEPMHVIADIPKALPNINPTIAAIGLTSLMIMIVYPYIKAKFSLLKAIPSQMIVLAVAMPAGLMLGLSSIQDETGQSQFLVSVPKVLSNPEAAFCIPDFTAVATATGIEYILLFSLIASIESLLSAQAVDLIDPWKRRSDMNRDLLATGVANTICSLVGALPMISEIVRSRANIDNGARTKFSNMFHGLFLLAFVLLLPSLITMIPVAALAAMLVFVGFRLASPKEFVHTFKQGLEQLIVFITTILVTLSTDLLIGVVCGIALKFLFHMANGAPVVAMLRPRVTTVDSDVGGPAIVYVREAAVFSNWLGVRRAIMLAAQGHIEVIVNLAETTLVDHSTMEKLEELKRDLATEGVTLTVSGLEKHWPMSMHPNAARKRLPNTMSAEYTQS